MEMTIDEIIGHCNRTCETAEITAIERGMKQEDITSKRYWEHYHVAKYLEELKRMKDAEEQELLYKTPCKIGDEFWVIAYCDQKATHVRCTGYGILEDAKCKIKDAYIWIDSLENEKDYWKLSFEEFKNQCFPTKEEAKAALAEKGSAE